MSKVRCKFCRFEQQSKCTKKKGQTTRLNKKRACLIYQADEEKITAWLSRRQIIPSESMPSWMWDKAARRAERDRLYREEMSQYGTTMGGAVDRTGIKDTKHPTTGDLSRFVGSTVKEKTDE